MQIENVHLTILSDGDRTVAEASLRTYRNPSVTAVGSSGREPGDKSNPLVGENLAVARALRSIANRLERQAQGYLRHAESNKAHKEEIAEKKAAGAPTGEHVPRWSSVDGTGGRGDVGWNARKGFPPISDLPQEGGPIKGYDQGFDRL